MCGPVRRRGRQPSLLLLLALGCAAPSAAAAVSLRLRAWRAAAGARGTSRRVDQAPPGLARVPAPSLALPGTEFAPAPAPGALPPPFASLAPPSPLDALKAAGAARRGVPVPDAAGSPMLGPILRGAGSAPLVPTGLADEAARLAWEHLFGTTTPCPGCPGPGPAPAPAAAGSWAHAPAPAVPLTSPRLGPPKPPPCPAPPRPVTAADVALGLQPFQPVGAIPNSSAPTGDGGVMWRLQDGGWGFQYPDMAARVEDDRTQINWLQPPMSLEVDGDGGTTYHNADKIVHRDADGSLTYHQPTGTIHQTADEIIYHWCHPNVIVYRTPSGVVYYDDLGMTYWGADSLAHYARSGETVYQGVGGVTRQYPDGSSSLWTDSGVVNRHADGLVTYTVAGETQARVMSPSALPRDPFPGPPLTAEQLLAHLRGALAAEAVGGSVPEPEPVAAAPAPALPGTPPGLSLR